MLRTQTSPVEVRRTVIQFANATRRLGLDPDSEAAATVRATTRFAGWKYRITRELVDGLIDCSTLASQAHWAGAAVGIPFVAETQRLAYSAKAVKPSGILPSDLLVRYPSREASPDGRHNHVVLYLGEHPRAGHWVIEASETGNGVRTRPMADSDADGGIRRFLPHPTEAFASRETALSLASAVPKLGRLGCRLTAGLLDPRRHRGVDIYCRGNGPVAAPLSGRLVYEPRGKSEAGVVHVIGADSHELVSLRPIALDTGSPARVEAGEPIGWLAEERPLTCNSIPALRGFPFLHFEYWSSRPHTFIDERDLPEPSIPSERPPDGLMKSFNPIYAIKLGLLASPISDLAVTLTLPTTTP